MDAIANTHGLLGAQKGAAWNYQSPARSSWEDATSVRFDLGRGMTLDDLKRYRPMVQEAFGGSADMLPDPSGFKFSQFYPEAGAPSLGAFVQELRKAHPELRNATPTTHDGNYILNAWDEPKGRYGRTYGLNLEVLKIPELGKKFDSIAPQVADRILTDLDPKMARGYGLNSAEDIDLLRRTIAEKGWDGLMNLVKSGNVSRAVVPLFLSWMGFQVSREDGF